MDLFDIDLERPSVVARKIRTNLITLPLIPSRPREGKRVGRASAPACFGLHGGRPYAKGSQFNGETSRTVGTRLRYAKSVTTPRQAVADPAEN